MRIAAKKDDSHNRIKRTLESCGFSVADTYQLGKDFPDMVAGRSGKNYLIEAKSKTGKLSIGQKRFADSWCGGYYVLRSADDAINFLINSDVYRYRVGEWI
ncbi:MAG: hypothetical protein ABIH09_00285 [Candidatus Omnitrophota bacterium]